MGIASLIYAFFYTLFLYHNPSGITYPFFAGGSCLLFFYYLKKSAPTAGNMLHGDWPGRKYSLFITACLLLLGFSVCYTDSLPLQLLAKLLFFFLFMYLMLSNTYRDKDWDFFTYLGRMIALPFTAVGFLLQPFAALHQFFSQRRQKPEKNKYFVPVLWGLIIAIPVLCVILLLLGSADMVFGNLLEKLFTFSFPFQSFGNLFRILFLFLFAFFCFLLYAVLSVQTDSAGSGNICSQKYEGSCDRYYHYTAAFSGVFCFLRDPDLLSVLWDRHTPAGLHLCGIRKRRIFPVLICMSV